MLSFFIPALNNLAIRIKKVFFFYNGFLSVLCYFSMADSDSYFQRKVAAYYECSRRKIKFTRTEVSRMRHRCNIHAVYLIPWTCANLLGIRSKHRASYQYEFDRSRFLR